MIVGMGVGANTAAQVSNKWYLDHRDNGPVSIYEFIIPVGLIIFIVFLMCNRKK